MNLLHCKIRRYTYGVLAVLMAGSLATVALVSKTAVADDQNTDQNTIVRKIAAPELTGTEWLNMPHDEPLKLAARRGKVTVLHFWTFGCINCKRNLPAYARWQRMFSKQNVQIIGVHTPETDEEKMSVNVARNVKKVGITYPVLIDGKGENWKRWHQSYWPTVYLIDRQGNVRYQWEGELGYDGADGEAQFTRHINELLREKP
jgi:thiol-disulfide isomerase/thioredoxin